VDNKRRRVTPGLMFSILTKGFAEMYASTRKVPEPKQAKREEKPAVAKETVTETRVVHDDHDL
jgi:hypothetical protein